jgi:Fe2+ or Zn2+ uptake regulation protein
MPNLPRFHSHLSLNHHRRSRQKDFVFEAIALHQPITIRELARTLAGQLGTSTLYRHISEFETLDVIIRSNDGSISLSDRFSQHHHQRICRACGRQSGIYDEPLEKALMRYAKKSSFAVEDHRLEFIGLCQLCQANTKPRPAIGLSYRRAPGPCSTIH